MNREVSGQSSFSVCDDEDLPSFWEAYRALGQCYEAEIARLQGVHQQGVPSPFSGKEKEDERPSRQDASLRSIPSGKSLRIRRPSFEDALGGSASHRESRESLDERAARAAGHKLQQLVPLCLLGTCTACRPKTSRTLSKVWKCILFPGRAGYPTRRPPPRCVVGAASAQWHRPNPTPPCPRSLQSGPSCSRLASCAAPGTF